MKGALLYSLLAGTATAHMQMMKPYPIRSPLNKNASGQKDYSYTNPLQSSGSDYPCKGYANDPFDSQATYSQGQSYTMELDGSATHDGGSCQLALTYDQGKSFKVIESMLGDCPIAKKYDFSIPSDAPDGKALLAWTWFNKVGNREMYMNCAMVTIGGASNGNETDADADTDADSRTKNMHKVNKSEMKISHPPMALAAHQGEMESQRGAKSQKQQASFDSLPPLFVANVNQEGKCVTIEGEPVNFPKPGDNVLGKTDGKGDGYKCSGTAPFLDSSDSASKNSSKDSSDSTSTDNTNSKAEKSSKASTQVKGSKASKTNNDSTQTKTSTDSNQAKTSTDLNQAKTTDSNDSKTNSKDCNKNATRSTPQSMSKIAQAFGTSGVPVADPRVVATDASTVASPVASTVASTVASPVASTVASTNNAFSSYVGGFTCKSGETICSPDGYSWAMCSNAAPVFMGSVAAGMTCRFGAMVAAPW